MEPQDKHELVTFLDSGRDAFIDAVGNVTDRLSTQCAAAGTWSVLQCVEHVAVSEEFLFSAVERAAHGGESIINSRREAAIRRVGADRTRRVESPEAAQPRGRFLSVEEGLEYFLACRRRTVGFLENCDQDLRAMRTEHPIFGPLNCYEMILLIAVHPQRHAKQIHEIRKALAQP